MKKGLQVVYHYNCEALSHKTVFKRYNQRVRFSDLPDGVDSTIFFLAKNPVSNAGDHRLNNRDTIGFVAAFDPPMPRGHVFSYELAQTYRAVVPLWGHELSNLHRDYRMLRNTDSITRHFSFPANHYSAVEPKAWLLDTTKRKKLHKIPVSIEKSGAVVKWTVEFNEAPQGTVLRVAWERPA